MKRDTETVAARLAGDTRVAASIGTAARILSTGLHAVAAGATWGARLLDDRRLQPPERRGDPPRGAPGRRGDVVHYVAGELCCVVTAGGLTAVNAGAFYDFLWQSLDATTGTLVKEWLADPLRARRTSSFDLDMAPSLLGRLAGAARVRQYVGPLERVTERAKDEPFVVLDGPDGQPASLLAFCSAARADLSPDERRECVRELVNLVNVDVERVNRDLAAFLGARNSPIRAARLEAITPNWLAAGTPEDLTDAGPGTTPAPAPPQTGRGCWQLQFDRATSRPSGFPLLADVVQEQRSRAAGGARSGVLVAILDTCPSREQVTAMATAHPENTLLQEVANPANVRLGEAPSIDRAALAAALTGSDGRPIKVSWRDHPAPAGLSDDDYLMTDHGLFAAGIVRDVAPTADIRLIRVLDDYGVGDLFSLTRVMSQLPRLVGTDGISRIVVNLSLVLDVPPDAALLEWWFPRTSRDPASLRQRFGDVCRVVGSTYVGIERTLDWLRDDRRNILVVAAAGNDYDPAAGGRPAPRLPARDDTVLGVAAVDTRGAPASYSNKGDFVVLGNGVATFGGDAAATEAMIGLFTASVFPLSAPPNPPATNQSSWAYWAGTSFATPVISAIAASLWASGAGASLSPAELIAAVRGYAGGGSTDLDCPYIPAHQTFVTR